MLLAVKATANKIKSSAIRWIQGRRKWEYTSEGNQWWIWSEK